MTILNGFGFTPEQIQFFQKAAPSGQWRRIDRIEHDAKVPDPVWMVHIDATPAFMEAVADMPDRPKAILWVPRGHEGIPSEAWWEVFDMRLREGNAIDRASLERLAQCPQVLDWAERVEDIPSQWFIDCQTIPQSVDRLPFEPTHLAHLQTCSACRDEAFEHLGRRVERRLELTPPSMEQLTLWLKSEETDPRLEGQVAHQETLRETVKRLAMLYVGAKLITKAHAEVKFRAVGLPVEAEPFLSVSLSDIFQLPRLPTARFGETLTRWATGLAEVFGEGQLAPTPATTRAETLRRLGVRLSAGDYITIRHGEKLFILKLEPNALQLQVARRATQRLRRFSVVFHRGGEVVLSVAGTDGVVRLTTEHFETAECERADRLRIIDTDAQEGAPR
jgi:hypothetical protein